MNKYLVILVLIFFTLSCKKQVSEYELIAKQKDIYFLRKWEGVYLTSDRNNMCKSVIMLYILNNNMSYISINCTDNIAQNAIQQEYERGNCLVLNNFIFLTKGVGYYNREQKPELFGTYSSYRLEISQNHQNLISEYIDKSNKNKFITILSKVEDLKRDHADLPPVNNLKKILAVAHEKM